MINSKLKRFYLLDELDTTLALVGVIISLVLTIWLKLVIDHPIFTTIGIFCFIPCTGYLIIRRTFYPCLIPSLEELRCSHLFYITLNILFFLLLSYSIIIIYLRPDPYIRPLGYFISIAIMSAILACEILFLSPKKSYICFALCKIIVIGLSLVCSQILIFPNVVGVDPWYHQWFTLKIIDNGHIPEGLPYSKLPMMHLMIGMTSLVTNLSYKMATMVSISFLQVVSDALFVFLLGKFLINTKVGLLAALLLEVADQHIHFSYWTIPNTMAAILILPIVFILFKIRKDKSFIGTLVVMFLMGTLILTHTVTAMSLAILIFVFWAGSKTYTRFFHQETGNSITLMMSILFSTGMLAYWTYISGHIMNLAGIIKMGFRGNLLERNYQYLSDTPFWEQIFMNLGMFLFFSLSFIGCFYIMSKQFRNSNRFTVTIGGIVILCLAFFSLITEKSIYVERWYYFSQILLAIPLALSLFLLVGIFKNQVIRGFLMSLSVFVLSFLLIMSFTANIDNHFFSPSIAVRHAFTESELDGMETISKIWNGTIGADRYSHNPYDFQFNAKFVSIDDSLYTGNFSDLQEILIIVREDIWNRPLTRFRLRLKNDPCIALEEQNFSRIYDCGSLYAYVE